MYVNDGGTKCKGTGGYWLCTARFGDLCRCHYLHGAARQCSPSGRLDGFLKRRRCVRDYEYLPAHHETCLH